MSRRDVRFGRLSEVDPALLISQMNDPRVIAHMPLATQKWDLDLCAKFVAGKEAQWVENGLGPWAFFIDGDYAGWGGFQLEGAEWDLGLVLTPAQFGVGPTLVRELLAFARADARIPFVTFLLPPSRKHFGALHRLGVRSEGQIDYAGNRFLKFRLDTDGTQ